MIKSVHILTTDTGLQAHAIRAAAEHFGASVTMTWVGNSAQLVDYFSNRPSHDIIILSAHGDERGMVLPFIDEEFRSQFPYSEVIRPTDFAEFLALDGNIILNNGCLGGTEAMAKVFLSHGAAAYIGAEDFPDTAASTKYALDFLYSYLYQTDSDLQKSHQEAQNHEDDRRMFRLHML